MHLKINVPLNTKNPNRFSEERKTQKKRRKIAKKTCKMF
jgi:hypothetical protein